MPPFFDIYVLSKERNSVTIEKFLARYCDRATNETCQEGDVISICANEKYGFKEQFIPVSTLTQVINYGINNPSHGFCFYLNKPFKGVLGVMLKFTFDEKMIFGVSIETEEDDRTYPYALQLAGELKKLANGYKTNITVEWAPSDDEDEFDEDIAIWKNMNDKLNSQYPYP